MIAAMMYHARLILEPSKPQVNISLSSLRCLRPNNALQFHQSSGFYFNLNFVDSKRQLTIQSDPSHLLRRVALVTGASRGIGRAIATRLAHEQYQIAYCYISWRYRFIASLIHHLDLKGQDLLFFNNHFFGHNHVPLCYFHFSSKYLLIASIFYITSLVVSKSSACVQTAQELNDELQKDRLNPDFVGFQCDISIPEKVEETVRDIILRFGHIDLLVNSAGIASNSLLLKMKDENLLNVFAINTFASLYMARAVSRSMIKRRKTGHIIFMGSLLAEIGGVGSVAYASSKAALLGATRSLAKELAPWRIRTNLILPDFVETDMTNQLKPAIREEYKKKTTGSRLSTVQDVGNAVWIAMENEQYNGYCIVVYGGTISVRNSVDHLLA